METYEDIQEVLLLDGIDLAFDSFTLKALRGSNTEFFRQEPSLAEAEELEYNFLVSTKDAFDNELGTTMEFSVSDGTYLYLFKAVRGMIHFTDGWSRIPATYIGKEEL